MLCVYCYVIKNKSVLPKKTKIFTQKIIFFKQIYDRKTYPYGSDKLMT